MRSSSSTMTSSWSHHQCNIHCHHDHPHQLVVAITGGVERKGERQSGVRRLNKMMQKLTSECKKGNCFQHIFRVKRDIIKRGIPKRKKLCSLLFGRQGRFVLYMSIYVCGGQGGRLILRQISIKGGKTNSLDEQRAAAAVYSTSTTSLSRFWKRLCKSLLCARYVNCK